MTTVLVASGGGHLQELRALVPRLALSEDLVWAVPESGLSRDLLAGAEHFIIPYFPPRDARGALSLVPLAHRMLRRCGAEQIISTGALPAAPFFVAGAALKLDLHYIESVTRSLGPSLSGRLVSKIPTAHLYTQYPSWSSRSWSYSGSVFDPFYAHFRPRGGSPIRRVVVTLGTECYPFRRAIERLMDILPPEAEVLWQTGSTPVDGLDIWGRPSVPASELRQAIADADIVVSHAGAGSALTSFELGKVPVLLPRQAAHGEHVDDHQQLIAIELAQRELAVCVAVEDLALEHLVKARSGTIVRDEVLRPFRLSGLVPAPASVQVRPRTVVDLRTIDLTTPALVHASSHAVPQKAHSQEEPPSGRKRGHRVSRPTLLARSDGSRREGPAGGGAVPAAGPGPVDTLRPGGSIIVPAHNESAVIGRTLAPLRPLADSGIELVVVANGCSDNTVDEARLAAPWATILDSPIPSKPHAIRLGEEAASQLPRLFLDADVVMTSAAAQATLAALHAGAVAARPPIDYDTSGASWPVRRYFRAREAMPSLHRHAWGAGVYGLSASARARFGPFPDVVGDDLWVDRMLGPEELQIVDTDPVVVSTPRDCASLLRVMRRAQQSKGEPGRADPGAGTDSTRGIARDLRAVAVSSPTGFVDALTSAGFAVAVRLFGRRPRARWERDDSSRTAS